MEEELYDYEQLKAYAIIAFNNWNTSGNREDRKLETFEMFIDSLKDIHKKENVIQFAETIKKNQNKNNKNSCST